MEGATTMNYDGTKRVMLCINGLVLGAVIGGMVALWLDGINTGRVYLASVGDFVVVR
jgi:hypothetical protein